MTKPYLTYACHQGWHSTCSTVPGIAGLCQCYCHNNLPQVEKKEEEPLNLVTSDINQDLRDWYRDLVRNTRGLGIFLNKNECIALNTLLQYEYVNQNENPLAMQVIRRIATFVETQNENVDRESGRST